MPPKKEEEIKKEEDNLLDDLGKLDEPNPDENSDDHVVDDPEPELSIIDQFVAGDLDAVRQTIQDTVIKTVSDVVNGTPEEVIDDPVVDDPVE